MERQIRPSPGRNSFNEGGGWSSFAKCHCGGHCIGFERDTDKMQTTQHNYFKKKAALTTRETNYYLQFGGFLSGRDGCKPDPKKVEALTEMELPQDQASLRSFLGLTNWFSHFWPDLSHTDMRYEIWGSYPLSLAERTKYIKGSRNIACDCLTVSCAWCLVQGITCCGVWLGIDPGVEQILVLTVCSSCLTEGLGWVKKFIYWTK